jgi:hypothetical protein
MLVPAAIMGAVYGVEEAMARGELILDEDDLHEILLALRVAELATLERGKHSGRRH